MRPILTSSSENLCENESIRFHCCLVLKVMTQPAQYAKEKTVRFRALFCQYQTGLGSRTFAVKKHKIVWSGLQIF